MGVSRRRWSMLGSLLVKMDMNMGLSVVTMTMKVDVRPPAEYARYRPYTLVQELA